MNRWMDWNRFTSIYNTNSFTRKQDINSLLDEGRSNHIDQDEERGKSKDEGLKRSLNIFEIICYGISATLGTGIYVTAGQVAKENAGPSIIFSFLFAGIISFLSGLCYSEFASRVPISGSAYSFAYVTLGELVAWFVGWNLTLEYAIAASAIAGGWTSYFKATLGYMGIQLPVFISGFKINSWLQFSPLSAGIILLCTWVLLRGMKESAWLNGIMTAVNLCIIAFFVVAGGSFVDSSNWVPFFPQGIQGTFAGVGIVFFSYIGFDSVATLAAEVKNPRKTVPIGIIGTLGIVTLLYIVVSFVLTGMVAYENINSNAPLSSAFMAIGKEGIATVVAIGSVTTITATALASLVGQPRIFYQMAKDGLFFSIFAELDEKGVPRKGTLISGCISAVIALFFDLDILLDMISIGTLLAFAVVCGGLLVLRYSSSSSSSSLENNGFLMKFVFPNRIGWHVVAFFIGCLFFSIKQKNQYDSSVWNGLLWIFHFIPMGVTFIPFLLLKENNQINEGFSTPFVPFVPCLGILMNIWFIVALPSGSLTRLFFWTLIGMSIYFTYGIKNSLLSKRYLHLELES
eukprot:TRINITY_DN5911_c0_g1_i1.p1 TRINITY_DN5911_c0_g1~~TRINITY_DN5911_c0_g1_i1.p1  ORF type:complete len:572 (+),score=138.34 TRINITY_DN5911_c0_g1_i1:63-1778(+)